MMEYYRFHSMFRLMQACCDVVFEYVHQRKQFNQPIGHFQMVQAKLADMYTVTNACRSYLYSTARAVQKGHVLSKDCAGVILFCSEKATQVALDAIQLLGECPLPIGQLHHRIFIHVPINIILHLIDHF